MKNPGIPIVGFSAWSGTGKTTLLRQIIPELRAKNLRVAVIKHAHHHFDLDQPGKDSYELRKSGASHTIICTTTRMAAITEFSSPEEEPSLEQIVEGLDKSQFDILLVEGYKHIAFFAKIELHRSAVGKPYLYPDDPSIIAIACDQEPAETPTIPLLDLNNPSAIADFIYTEIYSGH